MGNEWAVIGVNDTHLVEVAGEVWADEHGHAFVEILDEVRVVEGVEDGRVFDTVVVGG